MTTTTLIIWIASVIVAVLIGRKKNIEPGNYWALGILLGWIGCVILLFMKTRLPKAPEGMRAVKCPRCNTVQNVDLAQDTIPQCFQCQAVLPAAHPVKKAA